MSISKVISNDCAAFTRGLCRKIADLELCSTLKRIAAVAGVTLAAAAIVFGAGAAVVGATIAINITLASPYVPGLIVLGVAAGIIGAVACATPWDSGRSVVGFIGLGATLPVTLPAAIGMAPGGALIALGAWSWKTLAHYL